MPQRKEKLSVFLRKSIIKAQDRIGVPGNAQAKPFRIAHVFQMTDPAQIVPYAAGIKKRNCAEGQALLQKLACSETIAQLDVRELHYSG